MVNRVCFALLVAAVAISSVEATTNSRLVADAGQKTKENPKSNARTKPDAEIEATATQLVSAHLPELKPVLKHLRSEEPRQYDVAIRDLARSARRLETAKKRGEELYEIEVELLQAQSNAKLLTAKLKVRDSESDRKRLREAAKRLHHAELARTQYEVKSLQERLKKTQQQLTAASGRLTAKQDNQDDQLEKSYLNFLRKAGRKPERESSGKKK